MEYESLQRIFSLVRKDINEQDNKGQSSLILAVKYGYPDLMKALMEARPNLDIQDNEGKTALIWAVIYEKREDAKSLIKAGASLQVRDNDGKNAMDYANNDLTLFQNESKNDFKNLTERVLYTIEEKALSQAIYNPMYL